MSQSSQGGASPQRRGGSYSRARHRSAAHDSAHADGVSHDLVEPPLHPLIPRGPVPLIASDAELADLIAHLHSAGHFAYDSEFIGEMSYVPKLCLIQVATTERVALIDPLAELDLDPFWNLLADPRVLKIVHAGQQDVEPVVRFIGKAPANLFDTQIAAGFIAMPYPLALSKLVLELAGAKLGKGLTFTHWDQRPLSAHQLRYAADDVRYLPAVYETMRQRLEALGHLQWAMDESASICDPSLYRFDPESQYLRVRGAGSLQPKQLAVLKELVIWRDAAARVADSPPRAYLKDEILIDLARNAPKTVEKLDRVRGLPRPIEVEHGKTMIDCITRGLSTPVDAMPAVRDSEQSPGDRFRTDALWSLVQALAFSRSIDPNLIASRQDITELYRHLVSGGEVPHLLQGWRRQAVGADLLSMLQDGRQVQLAWVNGSLARHPQWNRSG
jgi:ribonuclease D